MNSNISRLLDEFFERQGWRAFRFQRSVWKAYRQGESGLIHSATGTGKTLAAWLGPVLHWLAQNPDASAWNPRRPPPLRVLWVTPLRALAGDTEASLRLPLQELGIPWQLEARTGDTKAARKLRQLKRLPTALITTPESLSLLLTHASLHDQLRGLEAVIVDEWHELLGTKRGTQTELAVARLRQLSPQLRIWGLSATLGNLPAALEALLGVDRVQSGRLIKGIRLKRLKLESLLPSRIERFPWSGHIGTKLAPQVVKLLSDASSALVFTNTRSQTEIWYQQLLKERPDWAGQIALHHGSLDSQVRSWVESGLREGRLRAVVCTSSLDLGVDFTEVDLVIQIGSPKGVARLLQRAGRSGHQPQAISRLAFVPTNAIELIELSAARRAISQGDLEARPILNKPLDVLAQHVVSVAIGGGFRADQLLSEIRSTSAYQGLTQQEWQWVLDFVVQGGQALAAYPDFQRVVRSGDYYSLSNSRQIRRHRLNIGTIVSDTAMQVRYLSGMTLGTAEESFLSRLKPGERFLFGGRTVSLVRIRDNIAYVRRASGKPDSIPRWMGGRMPLSSELSAALRAQLAAAAAGKLVGREMRALSPLLKLQSRWSALPSGQQLLIETISTRSGYQTFIFPFEGRLVHEGLAALVAYRLSRLRPTTFNMACNDYGFVLQAPHPIDIPRSIAEGLFSSENLMGDIMNSMNATEMAKRQFRQIARVAGLVSSGWPGQPKPSNYVQASSNLFFDVFSQYDPGNFLLAQSRREVLEQQLEATRMLAALDRIEQSQVVLTTPPQVTPLAFPLLVDKLRERVSSEKLVERVMRWQAQLEKAAARDEE